MTQQSSTFSHICRLVPSDPPSTADIYTESSFFSTHFFYFGKRKFFSFNRVDSSACFHFFNRLVNASCPLRASKLCELQKEKT